MPPRRDIEAFLEQVRQYIDNDNYDFINRDKYELYRLGISIDEAVSIIRHLSLSNYFRGPTEDHNGNGNLIYEFGYEYDPEIEIYIKLTIRVQDDLFIMSFHESDRPMTYPFRDVR